MANSYIVQPIATDKYTHILNTHITFGPNKWYNRDLPAIAHTYTYTRPLSPAFETALRHLLLNPPNHAHQ